MIYLITIIITFSSVFGQTQERKNNILNLEHSVRNSTEKINILSAENQLRFQKKKVGLAILYSLLLPGMGELYAESYSSGKYFTVLEGALWGIYIGMNAYSNSQEDNYKEFAQAVGGVNPENKSSDYYAIIGVYQNIDEYNNAKALERNFGAMLNKNQFFWDWKTSQNRKSFRNMWTSSEQASNNLRFVVGAMLLNRVASIINAVRLTAKYNKGLQQQLSWELKMGLKNYGVNLPTSLSFEFQKSF